MTNIDPGQNRTDLIPPINTGGAPIAQPEEILRLEGIEKTFGGVRALRGVSLSIRAGEIYHLLGENGSGKSTLIKIISGAQPPDAGSITVRGKTFSSLGALESLAAGIETVYQDLSLFPNMSVAENVALTSQLVRHNGKLMRGLDRKALLSDAIAALRRVGLEPTNSLLEATIDGLPIAVRQLVAIARGIASRASLVIMDEPTTALTQKEVESLLRIISALQADGVAVLFVSHKLDEVFRIGGNLIVIRDGQKVAEGRLEDHTQESVSFLMTGKTLDKTTYRTGQAQGSILLEVERLSKAGAFEDVSLSLHRGEVLGITGLLDSGRNELALALSGVQPADGGKIKLEDEPVRLRNPRDAIQLGIGYVPEDRLTEGLFLQKPIRDNIMVSILDRLMRGPRIDFLHSTSQAEKLVKVLEIATPNVMLPVQALSGGNQQRVMVARWLAIQPKVLLLHGPTMGVDVGSKDALYRIIQRLSSEGLGVIVISDDLPELLMNCDRILVMRKGRVSKTLEVPGLEHHALSEELLGIDPEIGEA
jgi:simple sugar transport system ATP-binding protein